MNTLAISTEEHGPSMVIRLKGRIDTASASDLDGFLENNIHDTKKRFVFSLSELEYICSSGLRSFIRFGKRLSTGEGSMVLCGAHGIVSEVFAISGFQKLFTMADSTAEALETDR